MEGSGWTADIGEANCLYTFFYAALQISTRLWRRQGTLYTSYPWKFAQIANPALTEQEARDIAQDLINAEQCCLDEGYSMRLQGVAASCTDLLPGGRLHKFGELLSYQKPLNAEIEDNFARHQSCARSARGSLNARETVLIWTEPTSS